jgi:hypothetical protein
MDKVSLQYLCRIVEVMCILSILNWLALDHVRRFEEICCSGRLPALKDLYYSFRFPAELEKAWKAHSFSTSDKWPFNDIGCFKNECVATDYMRIERIPKIFFIVYKHPINVLLKHTRSLFNYSFVTHASDHHGTNPSHSISWICNQVNEPEQVLKTFRTIRAVRSKSLCIKYVRQGVSIQFHASHSDLLMHICFLLRKA